VTRKIFQTVLILGIIVGLIVGGLALMQRFVYGPAPERKKQEFLQNYAQYEAKMKKTFGDRFSDGQLQELNCMYDSYSGRYTSAHFECMSDSDQLSPGRYGYTYSTNKEGKEVLVSLFVEKNNKLSIYEDPSKYPTADYATYSDRAISIINDEYGIKLTRREFSDLDCIPDFGEHTNRGFSNCFAHFVGGIGTYGTTGIVVNGTQQEVTLVGDSQGLPKLIDTQTKKELKKQP
jgi:hypothetical protein